MLLMDCPVRVSWSVLQPEWRPPQIQFPCDGWLWLETRWSYDPVDCMHVSWGDAVDCGYSSPLTQTYSVYTGLPLIP